jgi:hemerythrin
MALLEWQDSYSVSVAVLDEQHKKIFKIINKLFDSMKENLNSEKLKAILKEFSDYAIYHFKTEEDLFEKYEYGDRALHISSHDIYRRKIKDFEKKLNNKEDFLSFKVIDFMEDWWLGHVMTADHQYKEFFASKGVK